MSDPAAAAHVDVSVSFEKVRSAYRQSGALSYSERVDKLKQLIAVLEEKKPEIIAAVNDDFGCRASAESRLAEIVNTIGNIHFTLKHLKKWMKPKSRSTSIWFLPGKNTVVAQPLGVVGIMVPWNYPVNLAITGIATAISAGNRCLVKMSELTPASERIVNDIVKAVFAPSEVSLVSGDAAVAADFSRLPFNHLLFTGSTGVGKKVMQAAASNLTPVTLELGGKNPTLIADDYPISEACQRIAWGKTFNAGQTCVAPDYVLVPKGKADEVVAAMKKHCNAFYPRGVLEAEYTSIINTHHFSRLQYLLQSAQQEGARVVPMEEMGDANVEQRKLPLTLVINPPLDCALMEEEIFGPVLPVIEVDDIDAAIAFVNDRARPLALYVFTHSSTTRSRVCDKTVSGGVTTNDVMMQYLQPSIPFGGVGESGFGAYHGEEGFKLFSHMKSTFSQRGFGNFTGVKTIYPPYGKLANFMIRMMGG